MPRRMINVRLNDAEVALLDRLAHAVRLLHDDGRPNRSETLRLLVRQSLEAPAPFIASAKLRAMMSTARYAASPEKVMRALQAVRTDKTQRRLRRMQTK